MLETGRSWQQDPVLVGLSHLPLSYSHRGCQRRSRWTLPAGTGFRGVGGAAMFSKAASGTAETNKAQ